MTTLLDNLEAVLGQIGVPDYSIGTNLTKPSADFRTTFRDDWQEHYFQNNFLEIDPLPQVAIATRQPMRWSEVTKMFPRSKVMSAATDFGIFDGALMAHKDCVISLGDKNNYSNGDLMDIYSKVRTCIQETSDIDVFLTPKNLGVLALLAAGKNTAQIAAMAGVSEDAIKGMKVTIKRKLNAGSSAEAIRMFNQR